MSLPLPFETPEDYFEESLKFFREYQKLFNFANTDILVLNILDEINISNLEILDVFEKDFDISSKTEGNVFLMDFFEKINTFKVCYEEFCPDLIMNSKVEVPLSPKKKHEIVYLTREIKEICEQTACDIVVDFGSGLGYLDQFIYEKTSLKVLGLECNENHYVGAKIRQRKYHLDSVENVKYVKHTVCENSDVNIQEYTNDKFGNFTSFCITGLHACADLTIDAINLFLKMEYAKAMVLMPCCYHKMAGECSKFKNFPLSDCLRRIFEENEGSTFMNVPFLRLASQPPGRREDDLQDLVFNLLARATLQLYTRKYNYKLKRKKRKAVRTKSIQKDFTNYLQNAVMGFSLTNEKDEIIEFNLEELQAIWRETQSLTVNAAIFILLQNYLQPVIENFVLFDRLIYLKENGIQNCRFKKIFDENVSPRCLALISIK